MYHIWGWVEKFLAWHTKAAPNGKCCEGHIAPSMVRLMYQFQVVTCSILTIAKLFYFCHLKKLVRPETFRPTLICGRGEVHTRFLWGIVRERDHLEDRGIDERMILKWIFRKRDKGHGLDWSGSEQGQVVVSSAWRNEPSGSIQCREFLD